MVHFSELQRLYSLRPILTVTQAGLVCRWADDSQQFILEHFDAIHNSPPEIYRCALLFSPPSSWLHKSYSSLLSHEVKVIRGQAEWGTCSRTVSLEDTPLTLACWKDLVAVGFRSGNITIHDAITGIPISELSSHTDEANSVAFSPDGTFFVSGSDDKIVNLWDVQTGGVVRTFQGHTELVWSVSISPDYTMIASGSGDHTIRLWDVHTGEYCCIIKRHSDEVYSVCFSPTNSQILISASGDGTVCHWNVDGYQIGSTCEGNRVTFSSDGSHFVSWKLTGRVATVWNSDSGGVVAELRLSNGNFYRCCFSPDGKFVAGCVYANIYMWDISGSEPYLVETFIGHTGGISSIIFSSSLISSSRDNSIKFWQTGASPADQVLGDVESIPLALASIESVSLQATDGIAISSDSDGVVKIWDISTGLCKESFQTPAKGRNWRDVQLIDRGLTLAWIEDKKIHIWETKKGEPHQTLDVEIPSSVLDFSFSGDKSKVFLLGINSIQARSIQTGEVVGEVELEGEPLRESFVVGGSRIWVYFMDLQIHGWDFGLPDSTPVQLSNTSTDRPHLSFIGTEYQWIIPSRIENTFTGREVFQLSGRYTKPRVARCDSRYLVAGYESGEVLILDFNHVITQ